MARTTELTIRCGEARIVPGLGHAIKVILDDPDINNLFDDLDWDEVTEYVRSNSQNQPGRVFDEEHLIKWAEENGYVKQ